MASPAGVIAVSGSHRAQKRFGQHFLTDRRTADRIVGIAEIGPDDIVLEIGPGKGILTGFLLDRAGHVTAVEIDRDLVGMLRDIFADQGNFRLIEADILGLDLNGLFGDAGRRITVVSNLPYNISTPVIELLIRNRKLVANAVLMVQREVARRLCAVPGTKDYGLTTLNLALCARCRKMLDIKPGAFDPPPEVVSSVISITFNEGSLYPLRNEKLFREITGAAFRMRRKMIRNSMVPFMLSRGISGVRAADMLADAGIDPMSRPETLDVSKFVAVSNSVDAALSGCINGEKNQ
ncbi:16S rRNA (adenine(1518)-N(6)/adenine(1519)-N(6))-dimethyltransferase RsmA [bacterium]|nr:16S rRNA (adenine(1518)-N(6)/adenine(1519)-N(6))-dimethyltransferase RsmA [bacterium]